MSNQLKGNDMEKCNCNATRFDFNLNHKIRFKATDYGKVLYKANNMSFNCELELKTDKDGFSEMQLWSFMELFGPHFQCGFNQPCETGVVLINDTKEMSNKLKAALAKAKDKK